MSSNGSNGHEKSMVLIQLTGGNDALNTVIPYTDEHWSDISAPIGPGRAISVVKERIEVLP